MIGLIDIGAHYAEEYFDLPSSVRDNMNWLFFEPLRSNYKEMCNRLPSKPTIKCFNVALGNTKGEIDMYTETFNKGQSCSILKPKIHLKLYPWIKFDGKEKVKITRLDDVEYDRALYDTIHIDVQGYELEVLKGAVNSLSHVTEMTVEINKDEIYEGCSLVDEVDAFLEPFGFKRTGTHWFHELWGDATYKKIL